MTSVPGTLSCSAPDRVSAAPFSIYLYGGLSQEDEHVTVWEPNTGKTVAGNAAPYRKNLHGWLNQHPGWEEKADEHKSSKRRSMARRQRSVSVAFTALCAHGGNIPKVILSDIDNCLRSAGVPVEGGDDSEWTAEEDTRLKEAIVHLGERLYLSGADVSRDVTQEWRAISSSFRSRWTEADVLRRARDCFGREIESLSNDRKFPLSDGFSVDALATSLQSPLSSTLSFLDRQLLNPREPRITVWEPSTGRTVSGNAAPCRRNLDTWIKAHPGWEPKSEDQLSSSRRMKSRRSAPYEDTPLSASTSHLSDALDALILLSQSPQCAEFGAPGAGVHTEMASGSSDEMDVDDGESDDEEPDVRTGKPIMISASSPMDIPQ